MRVTETEVWLDRTEGGNVRLYREARTLAAATGKTLRLEPPSMRQSGFAARLNIDLTARTPNRTGRGGKA